MNRRNFINFLMGGTVGAAVGIGGRLTIGDPDPSTHLTVAEALGQERYKQQKHKALREHSKRMMHLENYGVKHKLFYEKETGQWWEVLNHPSGITIRIPRAVQIEELGTIGKAVKQR